MQNKLTIYYDVDETLVSWTNLGKTSITLNCNTNKVKVRPIKANIESLKKHKKEGFKIVVWSASGEDWAKEVVNRLHLNNYVDCVLSKPFLYVDDKLANDFMCVQRRLYYGNK